jgi:hypothetical protein
MLWLGQILLSAATCHYCPTVQLCIKDIKKHYKSNGLLEVVFTSWLKCFLKYIKRIDFLWIL